MTPEVPSACDRNLSLLAFLLAAFSSRLSRSHASEAFSILFQESKECSDSGSEAESSPRHMALRSKAEEDTCGSQTESRTVTLSCLSSEGLRVSKIAFRFALVQTLSRYCSSVAMQPSKSENSCHESSHEPFHLIRNSTTGGLFLLGLMML